MSRLPILLACLLLSLFLASCGGDDDESAATPEPAATATATAEAAGEVDTSTISKDLAAKPNVAKPTGTPPTELVKENIVKGKGPAAKPGDVVSMQYAGWSWSTGTEFDSSWSRKREPFQFQLGAQMVIPGWDQGIVGMKKGGRRLLVIPPDLAYGEQGSPPAIGPSETLIFVVDLEKIG
jgi:peptidylprolyl isomerase